MSGALERVAKAINENELFVRVIYGSGRGRHGHMEIARSIAQTAIDANRVQSRSEVVRAVSYMLWEWEQSDELYCEFAERLIQFVLLSQETNAVK